VHLVQILLPLRDNDGKSFPREVLEDVRHTLTEPFGGVTARGRTTRATRRATAW
jgi:hypothetical protein